VAGNRWAIDRLEHRYIRGIDLKKTEIIEKQFKELLAAGETVLATVRRPPQGVIGDNRVDSASSQRWAISTSSFLGRVFGSGSEYYQGFKKSFQTPGFSSDMRLGMAVLRSAWDDYSSGYLANVNSLITAEVFDDFLEQAEHLFAQGYYQPAAVLAGAVLEDTLRKLCTREGVVLPDKPKMDSMNAELTKKDAYNKLVHKQVTWLADIRNKAAHGQWNEFTKSDVETMLRQIREFVTTHMA
jgi:hypothetical protein